MSAPRQYADWAVLLERFARGDDGVLPDLEAGTLEWTAVVAERFTRRLHDAFFARLRDAQRRLQRDLDHARGDEAALGRALVGARPALAPIARVARLQALPDPVRAHLEGELRRMVDETNLALESSARADRAGGERLLRVVRAHALRLPPPAEASAAAPPAAPPGARRPILF